MAHKAKITGTVQGVWYRESAKRQAQELGVKGWIKNCSDGSVEAHLEGNQAAVRRMLAWCLRGSDKAIVDSVEATEVADEAHANFRVIR